MRDEGAPGPLTQASAPQAPGRLAREDARTSGGGTLEMAATGVAEHVQRRSGAYWRDLVFSRLIPPLFFSLFLARELVLLAGGLPRGPPAARLLFLLPPTPPPPPLPQLVGPFPGPPPPPGGGPP